MIAIRERPLQLDGPRGSVHSVINKAQFAERRILIIVVDDRLHLQPNIGHVLLHFSELLLRQGKLYIDWRDLIDGDHRRRVIRLDQVARVHQ